MLRMTQGVAMVLLLAATSVSAATPDTTVRSGAASQAAEHDAAWNAAFKDTAARLPSEVRDSLLQDQRQWLRQRNADGGLRAQDTASKLRPHNLSPEKSDCVARSSRERVVALGMLTDRQVRYTLTVQ